MSASISMHGPYTAAARRVGPGEFTKVPFVSVDIYSSGASVSLISIDADGLESLSAALGEARVLLASIATEPERVIHDCDPAVGTCYCGEPGEAQRIAEVFEDARAEMDRGL